MYKSQTQVESFTLDHTKVKAPYVRLIDSEVLKDSYWRFSNFDVRLTQPNQQFIDSSSLHTLEHSLAMLLRDYFKINKIKLDLKDASLFGCATGAHAITLSNENEYSAENLVQDFVNALEWSLKTIVEVFEEGDVPSTNEKECGNAAMHSLHGAKIWAKRILDQGISLDPYKTAEKDVI